MLRSVSTLQFHEHILPAAGTVVDQDITVRSEQPSVQGQTITALHFHRCLFCLDLSTKCSRPAAAAQCLTADATRCVVRHAAPIRVRVLPQQPCGHPGHQVLLPRVLCILCGNRYSGELA